MSAKKLDATAGSTCVKFKIVTSLVFHESTLTTLETQNNIKT